MAGYKGHVLGGIMAWAVCLVAVMRFGLYKPEPGAAMLLLCIVLLGALFPDTDTDSKGQNLFYGCFAVLDLVLILNGAYKWAAVLGFCALLPALGRHRGWTHTWWAMVLIPLPVMALPMIVLDLPFKDLLPFYLAGVLGYLSHLILDRKI
jgi:membrane-bound metal-dependent hydrolase YbcI (DUF457 family)